MESVVSVKKREFSISIIRTLAFLSIISCHIMQYYGCWLAWWFNVGVQIFLCLSGYLYGRKNINEDLKFYKYQFIKILIPYYIVTGIVIVAQLLFARSEISLACIAKALICYDTLSGGSHLWFIPTILFCYALTPLFEKINDYILEKKHPLLCCIVVFIVLSIIVRYFVSYFNFVWIACFYVGHVLGKNEVKQSINGKVCKGAIYFVTACFILIQIIISNILKLGLNGRAKTIFAIACDFGHAFLGTSILLILLDLFRAFFNNREAPEFLIKPINFLDSISYEGYLVHQFFIFGAFSLLDKIKVSVIAVITVFIVTFICGFLVKTANVKLKKAVDKLILKWSEKERLTSDRTIS